MGECFRCEIYGMEASKHNKKGIYSGTPSTPSSYFIVISEHKRFELKVPRKK